VLKATTPVKDESFAGVFLCAGAQGPKTDNIRGTIDFLPVTPWKKQSR